MYAVLGDADKRALYDAHGRVAGPRPGPCGSFAGILDGWSSLWIRCHHERASPIIARRVTDDVREDQAADLYTYYRTVFRKASRNFRASFACACLPHACVVGSRANAPIAGAAPLPVSFPSPHLDVRLRDWSTHVPTPAPLWLLSQISEADILAYEAEYRGSQVEESELRDLYTRFEGSMPM